jgi:biopolymer transport protein ExbD
MRIRPRHFDDPPEINLIPLIDVLLVIIIFLAISTTFAVDRSVQVNLPQAKVQEELPKALELTITDSGLYAINGQLLETSSVDALTNRLASLSDRKDQTALLIIRADANATHQSVISAMQAARQAGLSRISFAARIPD